RTARWGAHRTSSLEDVLRPRDRVDVARPGEGPADVDPNTRDDGAAAARARRDAVVAVARAVPGAGPAAGDAGACSVTARSPCRILASDPADSAPPSRGTQ